ncbi:MAG: hypothetical protein NTY19_51520 [Planctomycetota bacterium]|nr:hypothetical protein [Planctomycetota bacterium]
MNRSPGVSRRENSGPWPNSGACDSCGTPSADNGPPNLMNHEKKAEEGRKKSCKGRLTLAPGAVGDVN